VRARELTAAQAKEPGGGSSLEAGALVLADRGACCIDEFDKMTSQHAALLEAMEQQSISVAKASLTTAAAPAVRRLTPRATQAGVVCTVCARTVVLAAANPKAGHFRRDKSLLENLSLPGPLLSRFDVVFVMLDRPDERRDELLARNVVAMHSGGGPPKRARRLLAGAAAASSRPGPDDRPFRERIADAVAAHAAAHEPLPPALLRKYVAYCRHYSHPVLSLQACKLIQAFYLELRQRGQRADSVPITTRWVALARRADPAALTPAADRQLEAMVRLAQARARSELRSVVTESDARDVVSLMQESLMDALTDDAGKVDLSRAGGLSQSKVLKLFCEHLKKAVERRLDAFFRTEELEQEARNAGLLAQIGPDFAGFMERLCDHCFVLKKPGGYAVSKTVHGMSLASAAVSSQASRRSAGGGSASQRF
jgi:DNA helicase MCM8